MSEHVFETHAAGCPNADYGRSCPICDGGLVSCTVCRGAESCLPTECPEEPMSSEQMDAVTAGRLDFKRGRWVRPI